MNLFFILLCITIVPVLDYLWVPKGQAENRVRKVAVICIIVMGCIVAVNQHLETNSTEERLRKSLEGVSKQLNDALELARSTQAETEEVQRQLSEALELARSSQDEVVGLSRQSDSDTAWLVHQISTSFSPGPAAAAFAQGLFGMTTGRPEEAENFLKKAVRLEPGNSEALNNLGLLYKHRQQYDAALKYFRLAHDVKPGDACAA